MWRSCVLVGCLVLTSANVSVGEEDGLGRAAARLDHAFAGSEGIEPCGDEEFVRRAYLEIIGRIPTAEECSAFLKSKDSNKRVALADALIETPGHTSRMFNFWVDLLRLRTKLNSQVSGAPYIHWLKGAVSSDMPYDDMVRELLTAEGPAHLRDNGETGYYLRDRGMPEANMSNTMRAFLGTRMECAQCHDHPFDQWTQKQFFELTAFTGGMEFRAQVKDLPNADMYRELGREAKAKGETGMTRAIRRLLRPSLSGVYGSGTGLVRLPKDYQYDDAKPKAWVKATAPFGEAANVDNEPPVSKRRKGRGKNKKQEPNAVDSRKVFADWIASSENPFFTKSIVNRLWKRVMGRGLIEPVESIDANTVASNPELLAELEALMIEVDYDIDAFLRVLYRTDAWQAKAVSAHDESATGPLLRRMSAEQIWDSLLTLVVYDLDDGIDETGAKQADEVYEAYDALSSSSKEELLDRVGRVSMRMTDPDEFRKQRKEERQAEAAERKRLLKEHPELMKQLRRARRNGDRDEQKRLMAELESAGVTLRPTKVQREMQRASELALPAPDGHFLRQFGQSDHEQIDGAHTEASIPQVLSLLNGAVEKALVQNKDAVVSRAISKVKNSGARIEFAFLSVLGRKPSARERETWIGDFRADKQRATQDLLWTLVNSHEFLFIR